MLSILHNVNMTWTRRKQTKNTAHIEGGSVNYDGSRTTFPLRYGVVVDEIEIMKAMMEESETGRQLSCSTDTNDEGGGSRWRADNVSGGVRRRSEGAAALHAFS